MIVYELKCSSGHVFEGWFRDAATFDRQAAAGKVTCAECGDSEVAKAPMAPRLANRSNAAIPGAIGSRFTGAGGVNSSILG